VGGPFLKASGQLRQARLPVAKRCGPCRWPRTAPPAAAPAGNQPKCLGLDGLIERAGLSFSGACDLAAPLLHCSKAGNRSAEAFWAVATTLARRRWRRSDRRPPAACRLHGISSRSCAASQSWSSAWLLPGRGRPGGGSGLPCARRVAANSWPAGRLLRPRAAAGVAAALGAAAARHSPILSANGPAGAWAVNSGAASQLSGLV